MSSPDRVNSALAPEPPSSKTMSAREPAAEARHRQPVVPRGAAEPPDLRVVGAAPLGRDELRRLRSSPRGRPRPAARARPRRRTSGSGRRERVAAPGPPRRGFALPEAGSSKRTQSPVAGGQAPLEGLVEPDPRRRARRGRRVAHLGQFGGRAEARARLAEAQARDGAPLLERQLRERPTLRSQRAQVDGERVPGPRLEGARVLRAPSSASAGRPPISSWVSVSRPAQAAPRPPPSGAA